MRKVNFVEPGTLVDKLYQSNIHVEPMANAHISQLHNEENPEMDLWRQRLGRSMCIKRIIDFDLSIETGKIPKSENLSFFVRDV